MNGDVAVALAYQVVADKEAQPGVGDALGAEEGLEDMAEIFPRDTAAAVSNGDAYADVLASLPITRLSQANADDASAFRGVDGIAEDAGECLTEVVGAADQRLYALVFADDFQVCGLDAGLIKREDGAEHRLHMDGRGRDRLLVEAERLGSDFTDPG